MTEYIASSASVGLRPRISRMRRYSSSLRPSSRYGWGWSGVAAAWATVSVAADVTAPHPTFGRAPDRRGLSGLSGLSGLPARRQLHDADEEVVDLLDRLDEALEVDRLGDVGVGVQLVAA